MGFWTIYMGIYGGGGTSVPTENPGIDILIERRETHVPIARRDTSVVIERRPDSNRRPRP